jgi:hypothetical protein
MGVAADADAAALDPGSMQLTKITSNKAAFRVVNTFKFVSSSAPKSVDFGGKVFVTAAASASRESAFCVPFGSRRAV